MGALPDPLRERLAKLAGMLGSKHEGERAAAGLLATRALAEAGLTWVDVFAAPPRPIGASSWRADLELAHRHRPLLSRWEAAFVADLARLRRLTLKQQAALAGIAERLRREAPR